MRNHLLRKIFCIFYVITFFYLFPAHALSQQTDPDFLKSRNFENTRYEKQVIHFKQQNSKNKASLNPIKLVLNASLFTYQKIFSSQFSSNCLYKPTCSEFSKVLMKEYGLIKGVFLTADRLMRCNRLASHDISPQIIDGHSHKAIEDVMEFKCLKTKK